MNDYFEVEYVTCGHRVLGPPDPEVPQGDREVWTCGLATGHEGDHVDEDEQASWSRELHSDV